MRVLQVARYYYPSVSFGGPIQCTRNISKTLRQRGHEVTVYATDAYSISSGQRIKDRCKVIDGVRVFYFRNLNSFEFAGFFVSPGIVPALIKNINSFDVAHLHEFRSFQNLSFHHFRMNIPYVFSLHGEAEYTYSFGLHQTLLRRFFDSTFGRKLLRDASKIIALTSLEFDQLVQKGVDKNRISVIPNGIDPAEFFNLPNKGLFRQMFGLSNEIIILYMGRITAYKGLEFLIQAFASMKIQNGVKLVIAGPDAGYLGVLQTLVKKLNLKEKVLFTGGLNRRQVLAAYNDASMVVYVSSTEGFPIVPLESGIMGKPTIVSNHPGMAFVEKGKFGFAVDYGNVPQLKEKIERLLENDELATKFSENGMKFILNNFTWEIVAKQIESVYQEVVG